MALSVAPLYVALAGVEIRDYIPPNMTPRDRSSPTGLPRSCHNLVPM